MVMRLEPSRKYVIAAEYAGKPLETMLLGIEEDGFSIREATGETRMLLVAGRAFRTGKTPEQPFSGPERFAKEQFGAEKVLTRWGMQDYCTFDQLPMIGRWSGQKNILFA
ncbi:MAG: hypothetical protein RR320_00855, partial [Oscillospiraceae bacterium]